MRGTEQDVVQLLWVTLTEIYMSTEDAKMELANMPSSASKTMTKGTNMSDEQIK